MTRRRIAGLSVGAAILVFASGVRLGDAGKTGRSAVTSVTIDGRSFLPGVPAGRDDAALRRELDRMGVRLPEGSRDTEGTPGGHVLYRDGLVDSPVRRPPAEVPPGMKEEHSLRVERDGTSIELVFGRTDRPVGDVLERLRADGWTPAFEDADAGTVRVLNRSRRKESSVACVDETDRTFLLLRKVER
ncbi:MAG: hypothetical protein ACM3L8_04300 [Verrucomicrobiota bacterium]